MPIPANWLEELVIEWLDLDGFVISTSVFITIQNGGRLLLDVVGGKLDKDGRLLIRHCETAMFLNNSPDKIADRYSLKFSQETERAVRTRFDQIFGHQLSKQAAYEKWVISFQASDDVQNRLMFRIKDIKICLLRDFVLDTVLPTIEEWRKPPNTKKTTIPPDKWLLHLIDQFQHFGLIS